MSTTFSIPLRRFGKSDAQVPALGVGGHHLGAAKDVLTPVEILHQAIDVSGHRLLRNLLVVAPSVPPSQFLSSHAGPR
jgi:hypothetical protein